MSLRRRTALSRSTPVEQRAPLKRGRRAAAPKNATELFKTTVCAAPCIGLKVPGHVCEAPLQAMHVVPKRTLRRRGLGHLVYDPENGVAGCYRIHRRHDLAVEKIPRRLLPDRCVRWAERHGVIDALERHWPDDDLRRGLPAVTGSAASDLGEGDRALSSVPRDAASRAPQSVDVPELGCCGDPDDCQEGCAA